MADIVLKYSLLNNSARKQVNDFLDFLLQKQRGERREFVFIIQKKDTWSYDLVRFRS